MICDVYVFGNGMVLTFDEFGQQIPEYQGRLTDCKEAILREAVPQTAFHFGMWGERDAKITKDVFRRLSVELPE